MPSPKLFWVEGPGLGGIKPEDAAKAAGVELYQGGPAEAAVVTCREENAPPKVRALLSGKPVKWLELGAELGGGDSGHRLARAAAALAREAGRASLGALPPLYGRKSNQRVLVAGNGLAALQAAWACAAVGLPVILATPGTADEPAPGDDPQEVIRLSATLPAGVEVVAGATLANLLGGAGALEAQLATPAGVLWQAVGGVILAPAANWRALDQSRAPAATPLSRLDNGGVVGGDSWFQAVILAGVDTPASAPAFSRALAAALALQSRPKTQVTLLYSQARVAEPGGERLFREARQKGVLAMKLAPGGLSAGPDGKRLAWADPVLGEEVTLAPDLLLLAEELVADLPGFFANPVLWPWQKSLLAENPRLNGGKAAKSGLFLAGPVGGAQTAQATAEAAALAAAELADILGGNACPTPAVRTEICASCLTCVRVCPHGAPRYENDRIQIAPAACVGCGVCAAECPAEAIAPPGWSNPELSSGLAAGLAKSAGPKVVLFACKGSGAAAFREHARAGGEWPAGLLVFEVPCAGRVGQQLILGALKSGADGVLVAGCHEGNCKSLSGNLRSRLRTYQAAGLLAEMGVDGKPIRFLHLASNQPRELKRAVDSIYQALEKN